MTTFYFKTKKKNNPLPADGRLPFDEMTKLHLLLSTGGNGEYHVTMSSPAARERGRTCQAWLIEHDEQGVRGTPYRIRKINTKPPSYDRRQPRGRR